MIVPWLVFPDKKFLPSTSSDWFRSSGLNDLRSLVCKLFAAMDQYYETQRYLLRRPALVFHHKIFA